MQPGNKSTEGGADKKRMRSRISGNLYHDWGIWLAKFINLLLITAPFVVCWYAWYRNTVVLFPSPLRSGVVIAIFMALYFLFGRTYDAFLLSLKRISEMAYSQVLSIVMADGFMFIILWLMSGSFPNLLPALAALAGQLALSVLWCRLAHAWYFAHYGGQRTGIVYDIRRGMETLIGEYGLGKKFDIRFTCTVEECLKDMSMLDGMETVFLCGVHSHERNIILKYCVANNISVYMVPRVGDVIMSGAMRMHMFHLPMLRVGRYNPRPEYRFFKRAFDICSSLMAIIVASPVMLAIAAAIKLCDGGPVFYRQTRLTRNGRLFRVINLRWMQVVHELHKMQAIIGAVVCRRHTRVPLPSDFRHSIAGFAGVFAA